MINSQQVIYIASGTEQAHMLKDALRQQGIDAYVTNEALQFGIGDLPAGVPTAARVVVHKSDAEEARRIALDFDAAMREGAFVDEDEDELDRQEAEAWPACPHCNRPRHTSCPVCGTAGSSFPQAYLPTEEAAAGTLTTSVPQRLLVVCPTCDEPFVPQFLARCEWCGHHFRDGQEMPAATPLPASLEINSRAWIVLAGLVALVGAVLALFAYIAPKT
jgi:Putative prokaryotic signal transducing protein